MTHRGYKYKLYPTDRQRTQFEQFAGVCRLVYNIALEQRRDWYRHTKLSYPQQARELTQLRADVDWIRAVSQTCQQQALKDLDTAFQRFFGGSCYPTPRKRGINDSFRFQGREISIQKLNAKWSTVRLPKIGLVKFRDTRPVQGRILNCTVSLHAGSWCVSFCAEVDDDTRDTIDGVVGLDRGVSTAIVTSNGEFIEAPCLKNLNNQRKRAQRSLARKKHNSKKYAKARRRVARIAAKTARVRKHFLHVASTQLSRQYGCAVLENLNTKNMTKSAKGTVDAPGTNVAQKRGLNRSILEQGWQMFETMLEYKMRHVEYVNPAYTSQTCSACGVIDKGSRKSQAIFHCTSCDHEMHADINAAINIKRRWNTPLLSVEPCDYAGVEAETIPNPRSSGRGRC